MLNIIPFLAAEGTVAVDSALRATSGINGSLTLAIAGAAAALAIGMIGGKAAEAVGRNPGAFGKILTIGIIAMALAEAVAIYALIMAFGKY